MNRTCEKCIHYEVCRYPLEWRAFPDTCWKYEEERPHGEWIQSDKDKYWAMCSVCKKEAICGDFMILTDFCPNCGADMREGDSDA